jgi:hypothetical protein
MRDPWPCWKPWRRIGQVERRHGAKRKPLVSMFVGEGCASGALFRFGIVRLCQAAKMQWKHSLRRSAGWMGALNKHAHLELA